MGNGTGKRSAQEPKPESVGHRKIAPRCGTAARRAAIKPGPAFFLLFTGELDGDRLSQKGDAAIVAKLVCDPWRGDAATGACEKLPSTAFQN